jgi:hypothetical protein
MHIAERKNLLNSASTTPCAADLRQKAVESPNLHSQSGETNFVAAEATPYKELGTGHKRHVITRAGASAPMDAPLSFIVFSKILVNKFPVEAPSPRTGAPLASVFHALRLASTPEWCRFGDFVAINFFPSYIAGRQVLVRPQEKGSVNLRVN